MASEVRIPARPPNAKESRGGRTPRLPRSCAPRKDRNRRGADDPVPPTGSGEPIVQNKANSRLAGWTLNPSPKKGYDE